MEKVVFALLVLCLSVCVFAQAPNPSCAGSNGKCKSCGISCEQQGPPCCGNGMCEPAKGESCETCPEDCGQCATCVGVCGNNLCEVNENGCNCPQDCGPCCCDGQCKFPETFETCPGECGGAISVRTIDTDSGVALGQVNVTCTSRQSSLWGLTDAGGDVVFGGLRPNGYTCTANVPGYYPNTAHGDVTPGKKVFTPSVIPLQKFRMGTISGTLRHSTLGSTLRGAVVTCGTGAANQKQSTTNERGIFLFSELSAGTYTCRASLAGFDTKATVTVNVVAGSNNNVVFNLPSLPASLQFTVLDVNTGASLPGVNVTCKETETGASLPLQQTNGSGMVSFPSITAERVANSYACSFALSNYAPAKSTVWLQRAGKAAQKVFLTKLN
eukprot:TRINITY_DN1610_c0_g1_i1.p1 TRINITY_DN1610_c0_g1~~TRINITY_DN1610_c0_g1_i1.p1  ORF type:complete len:403 (-),score=131.77 TRINITY_DN1610_c0_g1_i1:101-1252(-)